MSASARRRAPWDAWLQRVTSLCAPYIGTDAAGHPTLDGDQAVDGYSLDYCFGLFEAGIDAFDASDLIAQRIHRLQQAAA